MPTGYRETTIRYGGIEQVIRTEQTKTVAQLDRDHTRRVKAALHDLHTRIIDQREAEEIAWAHATVRADTPGFPGSAQRAAESVLEQIAKVHAEKRTRKFTAIKCNWDDARKGWPKVQFNIPVTDPRVRDCHEYIQPAAEAA
jgi:hypothetical protein